MGKNIQVDPSKIDAAASKLSELATTYDSIAKQLMSDATTMGEAWQGEDNVAFCNQIKGFTEELSQMVKNYRVGLRLCHSNHLTTNSVRMLSLHQ